MPQILRNAALSAIQEAKELVMTSQLPVEITRSEIVSQISNLLEFSSKSDLNPTYEQIRHLDENVGVIDSKKRTAGDKTFYTYTRDDVAKVIAIKLLQSRHKVSYRKAINIVQGIQLDLPISNTDIESIPITDDLVITTTGTRAHRYLWTRSLGYVLRLIFNSLPENTYLIVEQLEKSFENKHPLLTENDTVYKEFLPVVHTSRTTIAAKTGRDFVPYIYPSITIPLDIDARLITQYLFRTVDKNISYRLTLISPRPYRPKYTTIGYGLLKGAEKTRYSDLIESLLEIPFRKFEIAQNADAPEAFAQALVQIFTKMDYCAIFQPEDTDPDQGSLQLVAQSSASFRTSTNGQANAATFVTNWVHKELLPVCIENIGIGDARVAAIEESYSSIAVAPLSSIEHRGVAYLARIREFSETNHSLTQAEKDLFTLLSAAGGELLYNEIDNRKNAESLSRSILNSNIFEDRVSDDRIRELLSTELHHLLKSTNINIRDHNLAAIIVKIQNSDQFANTYGIKQINWLEEQVITKGTEIISRYISEPLLTGNLGNGNFLFLSLNTVKTEDQIKQASKRLKSLLRSMKLRHANSDIPVDAYSWAIVYSHDRYLRKKLQQTVGKTKLHTPELLAAELLTVYTNSADALRYSDLGHEELTKGNYPAADAAFQEAENIFPSSAYFKKHRAEARFGMGQLTAALKYCKEAIEIDNLYAAAHYMSGEIYIALGKFSESTLEYGKAIALASRPKNHWLFGTALARSGKYQDSIKQFREARKLDPNNRWFYDVIIAKLQYLMGDEIDAQNKLRSIEIEQDLGKRILQHFELQMITPINEPTAKESK